ncbi:polymorphic toxin-type HINT domain-containing protein [Streptomyces globisporus]|uniref:polymorphic toxin-type HINT domain-containing protein n=1 Tax=Streptomyces TaxID=1883 RepID=UPI0027BB098F|nr:MULTISPECIES: polymorphic toxin-type HINT domain-containing protein [Streptomyces]
MELGEGGQARQTGGQPCGRPRRRCQGLLERQQGRRQGQGRLGQGEGFPGRSEEEGGQALKKGESGSCPVSPKNHSFLPGTQVLLADGTTKPIEEIELGDDVVVTDPDSGETTVRDVVATITTENDKHFVDLTVAVGSGTSESLVSTTTHPFWSVSEEDWVEAGDLRVGMTLRTSKGDTVTLEGVRSFDKRQRTHDLTISGIHTYYVLAGATPVLVHNCGDGDGVATLHYHGDGNHFSIEVTDGETVTHTHLMPHDGEAVVSPYSGPPSIMSRDIDLPNGKAALEFQKNTQGSWGPYHPLGNSCLTYCANVLRAGGADVPEGRAAIPWARKFLSGGQ